MSEKLRLNNSEIENNAEEPAERFRVEADNYPLMSQQVQLNPAWGDNSAVKWNIDRTASEYVTDTANLVALMDGTAKVYEKEEREKPDHVVYLDKSARPVSWFVNTFWEDFSEEERPEHSYLNIDRMPWFRRAGLELDAGGYMVDADGTRRRPKLGDFMRHADEIPDEVFARIRALYVPGGVETEDLEEIKKMPTSLDGKNLLIVDEVGDTGSTLGIAEYVLKRAIPEIKSVNGDYFWDGGMKTNGNDRQQLSVPVWYSHDTSAGRGIGDVNEPFYMERYQQNPTPKTRAQALGALALSEYVNLDMEEEGVSRELAKEIKQLHADYEDGKVLLKRPENWDRARVRQAMTKQGLRLAPESDKGADTYMNVIKAIEAREAE